MSRDQYAHNELAKSRSGRTTHYSSVHR